METEDLMDLGRTGVSPVGESFLGSDSVSSDDEDVEKRSSPFSTFKLNSSDLELVETNFYAEKLDESQKQCMELLEQKLALEIEVDRLRGKSEVAERRATELRAELATCKKSLQRGRSTTPRSTIVAILEKTLSNIEKYKLPSYFSGKTTAMATEEDKNNEQQQKQQQFLAAIMKRYDELQERHIQPQVECYDELRERHIQRQVECGILEHVNAREWTTAVTTTGDGNALLFPDNDNDDDSEQDPLEEQLHADHNQMTHKLESAVSRYVLAEQELHARFALMQQFKAQLRIMLEEEYQQQQQGQQQKNNDERLLSLNRTNDEQEEDYDDDDMEEEEEDYDDNEGVYRNGDQAHQRSMQEQDELLLTLQQKKLQLEAELHRLQKDALEVKQEYLTLRNNHNVMMNDTTFTSIIMPSTLIIPEGEAEDVDSMEKENENLQRKLDQLKTTKSDYEWQRLLSEEVSGIKIESVLEEEVQRPSSSSLFSNNNNATMTTTTTLLKHITLQLLYAHRLRVTLETTTTSNSNNNKQNRHTKILTACFLPEQQPGKQQQQQQQRPNNNTNNELYLPPLEDLVATARDFSFTGLAAQSQDSNHSAGLWFLVCQALGFLNTYRARCAELEALQNNNCQVQIRQNPANPEDHLFQQVVCTFAWDNGYNNDSNQNNSMMVTVVLLLTPDCPVFPGSVYFHSLTACSGSNNKQNQQQQQSSLSLLLLEQYQSYLQSQQHTFASPFVVISQIRKELGNGMWKRLAAAATEQQQLAASLESTTTVTHS